MTKYAWRRCLAAAAMSAWLATTVSAQQAYLPQLAGGPSTGNTGSSDSRAPIQGQSGATMGHRQLVRFPPVESAAVARTSSATDKLISSGRQGAPPDANAASQVDGTWQEDGQYLILNLNGQQLRLAKASSPHANGMALQNSPTAAALPAGGVVRGQLSHRGRPLAGCEVALMPLSKSWHGYRMARSPKAILATTNSAGAYWFAQVASGAYQLRWRPAGEVAWIRRAEVRPDVLVHPGETTNVKEVRLALRTIN